ncbi:hypothetical protein AX16_001781 [Volvariella volvacea WC 439]|nr:hypothetical protein AX16_001781 [Volvariella volvacea WC 439]
MLKGSSASSNADRSTVCKYSVIESAQEKTSSRSHAKKKQGPDIVKHLFKRMANVNAILTKLESNKIKDVTEGLNELRNVFSSRHIVQNFSMVELDNGGMSHDPRVWLHVFQSLYGAARFGLTVYEKKPKTGAGTKGPNTKVLEQVASTIRWLTEQTISRINSKISKSLYSHLLQMMVYRGKLFQPVALDYIKTLKVLVSCRPHLDRMEVKTWFHILEIGFNCVLGDPIGTILDSETFIEGMKQLEQSLDEDAMDEDEDDSLASPLKRKRPRRDSNDTVISRSGTVPFLPPRGLSRNGTMAKPEQLEFTAVIAIILKHPLAPLPSSILIRLARFLFMYPVDTSMNEDFLSALSSTLSHLALNRVKDVEEFAKVVWPKLLGLWTSKNKRIKEALVAVLRVLFPFVTLDDEDHSLSDVLFDSGEGVAKLYELLKSEVENRSGVEPLTLDSLRLDIGNLLEGENGDGDFVFTAKTFRSGNDFDAAHALTWAMLELQADCVAKLFIISESMGIPATPSGPSSSKRRRREDPISGLLASIQSPSNLNVRIYHLQILLFFIDRHWSILHDTIRREVVRSLMQGLSIDDGPLQSWSLLCLAAIADNELSRSSENGETKKVASSLATSSGAVEESYDWDSLFVHSIRRTNVPTVCRAACHTAYTLLRYWDTRAPAGTNSSTLGSDTTKRFLSTHKVLNEIETLAKDLDVQGPSYPYDTVCSLLSQCLRVASQDVRLFRMQLEDKVLNWLMDSWRGFGYEQQETQSYGYVFGRDNGKGKPSMLLDVGSVLSLLEYVCGFGRRNRVVVRRVLPECDIVEAMKQENSTRVIRDFILNSRLSSFKSPCQNITKVTRAVDPSAIQSSNAEAMSLDTQTASRPAETLPSRGRERRISTFFVKSTEALASRCEGLKETDNLPTAESARAYLDMVIISLSFEALLEINGYQVTRRAVQNAAKVVNIVTSWLLRSKWTLEEKALILHGLDPLIASSKHWRDEASQEVFLKPDAGMGIRLGVFRQLVCAKGAIGHLEDNALRIEFLQAIWQNKDTQEDFECVLATLEKLAYKFLGLSMANRKTISDIDRDSSAPRNDSPAFLAILDTCVAFLAIGPAMRYSPATPLTPSSTPADSTQLNLQPSQSASRPVRNQQLNSLVLQCRKIDDPPTFIRLFPLFLKQARQQVISVVPSFVDEIFAWFEDLLRTFEHGQHEALFEVLIDLLDTTIELWICGIPLDSDEKDAPKGVEKALVVSAESFYKHMCLLLRKGIFRSWQLKTKLAGFFDRLLARSIEIDAMGKGSWVDVEELRGILVGMGTDEDIRVRFRAAVINPKALGRLSGAAVENLYKTIVAHQGRKVKEEDASGKETQSSKDNLDDVEYMFSRIVALGNIMVISSAVRRAAYWKLLEICIYTSRYSRHVHSVLTAVAERMGLSSLSTLSECYATQLAWSIQLSRVEFPDVDFTRFKPSLLGYQDRKSCAEAVFSSFTPVNLLFDKGRESFETHCTLVHKTSEDGILECFGDIVGYFAVVSLGDADVHSVAEEIVGSLLKKTRLKPHSFSKMIADRSDAISVAILRALSDQDISSSGPIVQALQSLPDTVRVWKALTRYRRYDNFKTHSPNLPAFPATAVLHALEWLKMQSANAMEKSTSYHVMRELFAAIHRSPLVNEQMRLVNGLSLWIALHHEDFVDNTLVHTLVHGAASLLSQLDLVRSAQSILEWGFTCYFQLQSKDTRLPDILIQICSIAHDYRANQYDYKLGAELERWIDDQTIRLSKSKYARSEIAGALLAWPHQPPQDLMKLEKPTDSPSSFLNNHRIVSNKFRLVRRLRDDAVSGLYKTGQWAKNDFWRLKDCMPGMDGMQVEDAHAFAELMILNRGFIDTYGQDIPSAISRMRSRYSIKGRSKNSEQISPRDGTILSLLNILEENDPARAYAAYQTLRMIMSIPATQVEAPVNWEPAHKNELEYLEQFPRIPRPQVARELRDLHKEEFLQAAREFNRWIALVTSLLGEILSQTDQFFAQLTPMLESDTSFAEEMLPLLVQTLLQSSEKDSKNQAVTQTVISEYFSSVLAFEFADVFCLRSVVDTVLHLRNCKRTSTDPLGYDKWLAIDYTLLSQSAILYGAYTTALLFLELAAEYSQSAPDPSSVERVLYEIYSHIDEPDGFYGIRSQDLHSFLLKRFHHEKQWEKAFRFHGAGLEAKTNQAREASGLLQAFHSFGFDHLAMENLQASNMSIQSSGMSYRLGWRTETWDLPDANENENGATVYLALRSIFRERDPRKVDQVTQMSQLRALYHLRSLGTENVAEIREAAQDIMCLYQVVQFRHPSFQERLAQKESKLDMWSGIINIDDGFEFSALENIMATRISLVRSLQQIEKRQQIGSLATQFGQVLTEVEKQCLLRLSSAARDAGQVQIALNSVIRARELESKPSFNVAQEFASVLWLQKEEKPAVQYLKDLLDNNANVDGSVSNIQRATLYTRLGAWTSHACLEKPTDIWNNYFQPAITLLKNQGNSDIEAQASVYHECAKFAERQYHAIVNSPDAMRWKLYVERKRKEIHDRANLIRAGTNAAQVTKLKQDQAKAQRLLQEDTEAFEKHTMARDVFLKQAIDMYSRSLAASDIFDDDSPVRFCSLWFANFDNPKLQDCIGLALDRIESRKMVFLAHQLSARLSKQQGQELSKPQAHLHRLIVRMCKEHPFHSLYQVFSIKAGTRDGRQSSRLSNASAAQPDRIAAAEEVFDRLRNDPQCSETLANVEMLCKACIEWATFAIKGNSFYSGKPPFPVPDTQRIRKILNLKVPVITFHTPIDPTLRYDDCVWIKNYHSTFRTAGGINLPKISVCVGSDGKEYKQLFKGEGNDDMRQDAVMEQVFELVNRVLRKDRETRRRELKVRDYKVIPLGTQAGLLEFVVNTQPLQSWLSSAHAKYRPRDLPMKEVREVFKNNQAEYSEQRDRLAESFIKLKERFKPVMRHYFTDKHKNPVAWFAMRLNYTRSVATTSIVGHMIGLGDRHISNILLDEVSGEVVHIDLGIAFDQGKLLPVPELVPFRMTADMVDGMGTSGTQGVFQRCAEETLRVLREGSEVIMTVLEVFKHDPLHSWTASELKVKRVQQVASNETIPSDLSRFGVGFALGIDMSSGTAEEAADRALSGVARKLDKSLSVEYTVNELIAEATDPLNLASIFYGWSPFC